MLRSFLQTDTCTDVGAELMSFAERIEANPPRVARREFASGLRRLAQRCLDGVRRATCRAMPEVAVPEHRSTPVRATRTTSLPQAPSQSTASAPSTAAGPSVVHSTGAATRAGAAGTE